MKKKRCKFPWKFHGAGAIECLEHAPGRVIYAGVCPECCPKEPVDPIKIPDDPYAPEPES